MPFETLPPPSYEVSTSKQWLTQVAPYLQGHDLTLAIRVCKKWGQLLLPHLWGDPAAHLPTNPEEAQLAFFAFGQALSRSRLSTRSLTHTLRIPEACARVPYQLKSAWLRQITRELPDLQSLVLPTMSFLGHEALVLERQDTSIESWPNLKLLSITNSSNVTTAGLLNLLKVQTRLQYVDLSGIRAARRPQVIEVLSSLSQLRVLNIAGLGLGDSLAISLFKAIRPRILHLDISKNGLTDRSVKVLMERCFEVALDSTISPNSRAAAGQQKWLYSTNSVDKNLYRLLTTSFATNLTLNDIPEEGIKSLNISHNNLSYLALSSLVTCGHLRALDAGNCPGKRFPQRAPLPDPEPSSLKSLRIPHHLFTGIIWSKECQTGQAHFQQFMHSTLDTLEQVEAERQIRLQEFHGDRVVPASHPQLRALTITNIPARSADEQLSQALIRLVKDCAMEWRLASLQTRLDYRLPPGQRDTGARLQRHARQLFALEEITLEMAPSCELNATQQSDWMHASGQMSMTGDADSEALWDAYASDFSFFGGERALNTDNETPSKGHLPIDNVAEVATFRKNVKRQYELALSQGEAMPKIDGYWEGKIKVVRP